MSERIRYFKRATGRMDKYIFICFLRPLFALKPKGKPPLHAVFDFFFLDWVYCH